MRKQKSLRPGAKAHPAFIPWLICLWCSRNHKDYSDKRKLLRPIRDHNWGATALNYITQRYPIFSYISTFTSFSLSLFFSLSFSLSLPPSPYTYTGELVWQSTIQKILPGEWFSPSVFFDEKPHEVEAELFCSKPEHIRKPDPFILNYWPSHLTPKFGPFCFSFHMEQHQATTPQKILGSGIVVLWAALLFH